MIGYNKEIIIGSDHAGFILKNKVKLYFENKKINFYDCGSFSDESVDYSDYAHLVATKVISDKTFGILICGSGNGVNITANKHKGIRSALCWNVEIAKLARLHNDANILALPARFIDEKIAFEIIDVFLSTEFEGGRHINRIKKIEIF